jgi:hypothetical protein
MNINTLPREAAVHLRLSLLGLGASIASGVDTDDEPFADDYLSEAEALYGKPFDFEDWQGMLADWAAGRNELPLNRLAEAGVTPLEIAILLAAGLAGEDPRFTRLFGNDRRATVAGLVALFRNADGNDAPHEVRGTISRLLSSGLLIASDDNGPVWEREVSVSAPVWQALGGDSLPPNLCALTPAPDLFPLGSYIADDGTMSEARRLAKAMQADARLVGFVRGLAHNGRKTLAEALARETGRALLSVPASMIGDRQAWNQAGLFAWLKNAAIMVELSSAPGESVALSDLPLGQVGIILVGGLKGGVSFPGRQLATIRLPRPTPEVRTIHWQRAAPKISARKALQLSAAFSISAGSIWQAARGARLVAKQPGDGPTVADVRLALRDMQNWGLEAVATQVETGTRPEFLVLEDMAETEMNALAIRCRNREALATFAGPGQGAAGVRALFAGPSGSGKTLAARRMGQNLERDIWRIDLAAAVNKYIGETEKALDRAFAAAEERDIILLLDEGDALMARRTDVGNSNDRYANLETNFLLQRIEEYSGILIVTSNAAERIDQAFQRRMDVVITFRAPDELRRFQILDHHLGEHGVGKDLLEEVAVRCALSGGQFRNIALHARLIALDRGGVLGEEDLLQSVFREYRKIDGHCPLKPSLLAVG